VCEAMIVISEDRTFWVVQVLHMDRNDYYGGAAASLNLNQVILRAYCAELVLFLQWYFKS